MSISFCTNKVLKVTKGNSFPLICTGKDDFGNMVSASEIENLKVSIIHFVLNIKSDLEFDILDGSIIAHITRKEAPQSGKYRVVIQGTYNSEDIYRNPVAFEIVNYVEQESAGSSCLDVQSDPVFVNFGFTVGSSGSVDTVSFGRITGSPRDNEALKADLEGIEDKIPTDYFTENQLNEILSGYATTNQLNEVKELIPTDYVTEDELKGVEESIPSLDGYATEAYVDETIGLLIQPLEDRLNGNT